MTEEVKSEKRKQDFVNLPNLLHQETILVNRQMVGNFGLAQHRLLYLLMKQEESHLDVVVDGGKGIIKVQSMLVTRP